MDFRGTKTKLIDFIWAMGKIVVHQAHMKEVELTLVQPSHETDMGGIMPAASITLNTERDIIALRDALNEMFPPHEEPSDGQIVENEELGVLRNFCDGLPEEMNK